MKSFSPPSKTFLLATCLIVGGVCGFCTGRFSSLWPFIATVFVNVILWLWGNGVRNLIFPVFVFTGIVLGARSEYHYRRNIDMLTGLYGPPPRVEVEVCEDAVACTRRDKIPGVRFRGRVGNLPVFVNAPFAGKEILPRAGDRWLCRGYMHSRGYERGGGKSYWIPKGWLFRKTGDNGRGKIYGRISDFIAAYVSAGLEWCPDTRELNKAILIGKRSGMSAESKEIFIRAGTIHVFAISGLHVMVVMQLFVWMLKKIGASGLKRNALVIPLAIAYVLVTGWKPSAVRALTMGIIVLLAPLFGRESDFLSSWSVTAILVFLFSPEKLFDVGCVFSFAVMLGIVFMLDASRRFKRAAALVGEKKETSGWRARLRAAGEDLRETFMISFASWIMALPISAFFFGRVSAGGLLAGIVTVALAQYTVRLGVCGFFLCLLCEPAGAVLNILSALSTLAMVYVSKIVNLIPFSFIKMDFWNGWWSLVWYAFWYCFYKIAVHRRIASIAGTGKWW